MGEQYLEVPVAAARHIATAFDKQVVVIIAWHRASGLIHATTYGESAYDKQTAAELGEVAAKAAGADIQLRIEFEDFRNATEAEWAVERETLKRRIAELEAARG